MVNQQKAMATGVSWSRWLCALRALLLGDRRSTLCHGVSIWTKVSRAWYWRLRWPLACALVREIHSLPFRTLAIHETGIDRLGVCMDHRGTLVLEGRIDHTGNRCRSADIQSLESLFPWATLLDVEIFLLGRMVGEKCRVHTDRRCMTEHAELLKTFSLQRERHPIGGTKVPLSEIVLGRKCSRLD
jgi:hypothetical protein